jgi:hypothetical protein
MRMAKLWPYFPPVCTVRPGNKPNGGSSDYSTLVAETRKVRKKGGIYIRIRAPLKRAFNKLSGLIDLPQLIIAQTTGIDLGLM